MCLPDFRAGREAPHPVGAVEHALPARHEDGAVHERRRLPQARERRQAHPRVVREGAQTQVKIIMQLFNHHITKLNSILK